jgi:predicted O-linked N-acetylglucosamine transferase (SPINDLY family)
MDKVFQAAIAALQAGKAAESERLFKTILAAQPKHVGALNVLSILLAQLRRFGEAEDYVRRALDENATSDATLYNYGIILKALGRPAEALDRFSQALALNAGVAETWNNRGTVFSDLGRYREAIADFDKAILLNPNYPDAFSNKGKSLARLELHEQSLDAYDRALTLKPDLAEAWLGRGNIFVELKRYDDAFAAYDRALALKPDLAEAWVGRGNIFADLQRHDDAFAAYDRAATLKPDLAGAWLGRGNIFTELKRHDDAFTAYDRAATLKPDLAEAWLGCGNMLAEFKRYDDALAAYDRALTLKSTLKYAEACRLHTKLAPCNWTDLEADVSHLLSSISEGQLASSPHLLLSIPSSPADQLKCAKGYIADRPSFPKMWRGEIYSHDRIRIAYLSADFREHPVAYMIAGLFEQHDKTRFETTAISLGADDKSATRQRIKNAFEHFVDVQDKSDQAIADLIRRREIDIAIDLNGFTMGNRLNVLARRVAPIQVGYFGYAGTIGADYIDHVIADRIVIPEEHFEFYDEKVVWLPESFMANDNRRHVAERTPTRSELNLPEAAFVFCCFNNTYKILPDVFDVWMKLLKANEDSVLWLLEGNAAATANLRQEAAKRGVAPERLIFAPKVPVADHLARHRQSDLFLDTLPYNAHTTASDALWVGLPVLTCLGSTYAGRVAASLLNAVGLADLITTSLEDYEALALTLARDRSLVASLKDRLAHNRDGCSLFNTTRFARHIEAAYKTMWERQQMGLRPKAFSVDPIT